MSSMRDIDLAFLEPLAPSWKFTSKYFPSKVGGRPAFLSLAPVIDAEQVTCSRCKQTMRFVLQIYAPIDAKPSAFHRTLLVFACGRQTECANEVRCFRSQLAKENRFYQATPPDYDATEPDKQYEPLPGKFGQHLCQVCGVAASQQCSQCRKVHYCSRQHQTTHWKAGHKTDCPRYQEGAVEEEFSPPDVLESYIDKGILFPEFAIEMEPGSDEEDNDQEDEDEGEDENESKMEKYKQMLNMKAPVFQGENLDDVEAVVDEETKVFNRFAKSSSGGEIIRYRKDWHGLSAEEANQSILWISSKNQPTDVPNCEACGSKRSFEFQIMPHLLQKILPNRSLEDHLDWGTVLVFSCTNSCQTESYLNEFVFVQNVC